MDPLGMKTHSISSHETKHMKKMTGPGQKVRIEETTLCMVITVVDAPSSGR